MEDTSALIITNYDKIVSKHFIFEMLAMHQKNVTPTLHKQFLLTITTVL